MLRLLFALLLPVAFSGGHCLAAVNIPVRTYIPLRTGNVTVSPFYTMGYNPDNAVDMLWYWANPPRIANSVSGNDGWIIRRQSATVTAYKWLYANGQQTYAYKDIYRFNGNQGWAVEGWQQNIATGTWTQNFNTGYVMTPLWDWWDECGFSTEFDDSRVVYPGETGLSGRIDQAITTTIITLKASTPRLLPREIILDFAGERWPEPLYYGHALPEWWYIEDVALYPGGYSMKEIMVTPITGKNSKIEFYQIRPIGLILSQNEPTENKSIAIASNTTNR